ncbi:MAG TPA: FAD-dependent oxidoreductase [Candidatus Gracilibacteria bacterium]|nr:FAD-dependent oxidoreductase [Candidatus Gracilibacteria bacterium]
MPSNLFPKVQYTSLWNAQEKSKRPRLAGPKLSRNIRTDTVIIGAGFTGLSAAWLLKKKRKKFIVLEKGRVGEGASGNNSGIIWPGYIPYMYDLVHTFDYTVAKDLYEKSAEYLVLLEKVLRAAKGRCDYARTGVIALMRFNPKRDKKYREETKLCGSINIPVSYSARKPENVKIESSPTYNRYFHCKDGASFNSGKFLTFLAKKCADQLYEQSGVEKIEYVRTKNEYLIWTREGSVRAKKVILATNAYALKGIPSDFNLTRQIRQLGKTRKAKVFSSFCLATRPLSEHEKKAYSREGSPAFYTSDSFYYYGKLTTDHRLIFGGLDKFKRNSKLSFSNEERAAILKNLFRSIKKVLPKMEFLKAEDIEYFWGGFDVQTRYAIPIALEVNPGLYFGGFYDGLGALNGFGIGKTLAEMAS